MKRNNKQQGFTIIELVVVILLLGILTATALPRFMDVTDEAHGAVVNGVATGLQTASALAHASWIARGQPTSLEDFANMKVNTDGYVTGTSTGGKIKVNADCVAIFDNFLQAGRPVVSAASNTGAAFASADISPAPDTSDFVAKVFSGDCFYAYTGQYKTVGSWNIPVLTYDSATGSVTVDADAL